MQQASYLEGGLLMWMWMLPLYLQVNQKSDYDDDMMNLSIGQLVESINFFVDILMYEIIGHLP